MVLTLLTAPKANCRSAQKVSESKVPCFSVFRCFYVASVKFLGSTSGRSTRSGRSVQQGIEPGYRTKMNKGCWTTAMQKQCGAELKENISLCNLCRILCSEILPGHPQHSKLEASCMQKGIERVLNGCWTGIDGIGRGIERDPVSQGLLFSATADDPARKNSLQWKLLYTRQQWASGSKYLCQGVVGL